jgi:hypothetical protein
VCGGDGGGATCGGDGFFVGWVTIATAYRNIEFGEWLNSDDGYVDELLVRPVIDLIAAHTEPQQAGGDDGEPGHVVNAVAGGRVRHPSVSELNDPDVIGQPNQVVQPERWERRSKAHRTQCAFARPSTAPEKRLSVSYRCQPMNGDANDLGDTGSIQLAVFNARNDPSEGNGRWKLPILLLSLRTPPIHSRSSCSRPCSPRS